MLLPSLALNRPAQVAGGMKRWYMLAVASMAAMAGSCSSKPTPTPSEPSQAPQQAASKDAQPVVHDAAPARDAASTPDALAEPEARAQSEEPETIKPTGPPVDPKLAKHYIGDHSLGVNRITEGKRVGLVQITAKDGYLLLSGSVARGPYNLAIEGQVKPKNKREFVLEGFIAGSPNLEFRGEPPFHRTTMGSFTFRTKGKRKYWRLYEVNGADCVCYEGCGNEFCYIDIGFGPPE